jgi:hypothetical protein
MRCSSSGQDFTVLLKQTVEAKRLSGGKVQEIVQTGVKFLKVSFSSLVNLSYSIRSPHRCADPHLSLAPCSSVFQDDLTLLTTLYKTHKSLPPKSSAKISSLYILDSLCRGVYKLKDKDKNKDGDGKTAGLARGFLSKVEGILEGWARDMCEGWSEGRVRRLCSFSFFGRIGGIVLIILSSILVISFSPVIVSRSSSKNTTHHLNADLHPLPINIPLPPCSIRPNPQEKMIKILDIWTKSQTFSPAALARVQGIIDQTAPTGTSNTAGATGTSTGVSGANNGMQSTTPPGSPPNAKTVGNLNGAVAMDGPAAGATRGTGEYPSRSLSFLLLLLHSARVPVDLAQAVRIGPG